MVRITRVFSDADIESIVNIAMDNYASLVSQPVQTDSPIGDLARTILAVEVRGYLAEAASPSPRLHTGVVLAKNAENEVVGFAIFIRAAGSHCGLSYCAVAQSYRKQGIFRRLIDDIKSRFSAIGLTCHLNTVEVYERLGFVIYWRKDAQVEMSFGPYDATTKMDHIGFDTNKSVIAAKLGFSKGRSRKELEKLKRSAQAYNAARITDVERFLVNRQITKP